MGQINANIPRRDRAAVQGHLDSLNAVLPAPDLNQMDVAVHADGAGVFHYSLVVRAERRVMERFGKLVGHQAPSPTSASLPAISPAAKAAAAFFGVPLPEAPAGPLDTDDDALTPDDADAAS